MDANQLSGPTGRQSAAAPVRVGSPAESSTDSWWAASRCEAPCPAEGHHGKRPWESRLKLTSQCPPFRPVTGSRRSRSDRVSCRGLLCRGLGTLSRDDEFRVSGGNPGVLPLRQLSEPPELVPIRPDDPVPSRWGAACVDPTLPDPVVN